MEFDWHISLGNILTACGVVGAIGRWLYNDRRKLLSRLDALERRMPIRVAKATVNRMNGHTDRPDSPGSGIGDVTDVSPF